MKSLRYIFVIAISTIFTLFITAQTNMFDDKIEVGNGLYKVKSNNRWGLIDKNDNLILSIEYNEPLFMDGIAIVTKYGSEQINGIIDSIGNFKATPPYYINIDYPYVTDGMLAVRETLNGKWGFLNINNGQLLTVNFKGYKPGKDKALKALGINGKDVKGDFVFDFVAPFVEGIASVHTEKTGWHHIDKNGQERFKNPNQKPTILRTSLHNGEAVIFEDRGIVLCKEDPNGNAGIVKYIDDKYEVKNYSRNLRYPYVIDINNSKLILNEKFQADKYENVATGDSIIFIERLPIVTLVEEPQDTDSFTLDRDIKVTLSKKVVSAGAKGTAAVTINVTNTGEYVTPDISVSIDIHGTKKVWEGTIAIGTTQQITLYIPAKFSSASISRNVEWIVKSGEAELVGSDKVSIKRYKPSRR